MIIQTAGAAAWDWIDRNRATCIILVALLVSLVFNSMLLTDWSGGVKDAACSKWLGDVHLVRAEQQHFRAMNVTLAARLDQVSDKMDRVLRNLDATDTRVWAIRGSVETANIMIGTFFGVFLIVVFAAGFLMFFCMERIQRLIKIK